MTWVKIDDLMMEHPKIIGLSDASFRVHIRCICWTSRHLADGHIPDAVLPSLGATPKRIRELSRAGLWHREKRRGWEIHDYLSYNRSRSQVDQEREDARTRMRKARRSSGEHKPNKRRSSTVETETEVETEPEPELVRPSVDDEPRANAVAPDGRTDKQGKKNSLTPSGWRLARWVDRYVPRTASRNAVLGDLVEGGTFVGAERLIRQHGARQVLAAVRVMSEERELSDGYAACWQRHIKSPAEYLAWYLRDDDR